jgi:hypothetical protein
MADLTEQQLLSQDPEILGLQRQRALANLLTGQAFNAPQGQMISGRYVKPSGLQQALPMINAAIGGLTNANLDEKQVALAAALRGKQAQDIQTYAELQKTDPAKAIQFGLTSQNPTLKAIVAEDLKTQKYGEGEIGKRMNLSTGLMETIGQGNPKYRPPLHYDLGNYISVHGDPNDPTKETQRLPKNVAPGEAARLAFEGIPVSGSGSQLQGQPQVYPQGQPTGQPMGQPQAMPQGQATNQLPLMPPLITAGMSPKDIQAAKTAYAQDLQTNVKNAYDVYKVAGEIEKTLPEAHGSGIGNIMGGVANFVGYESSQNAADAKLKVMSDKLLKAVPRFSGPQSDKDVQSYKEAAGSIGDASLPMNVRLAALQTIKNQNKPYAPNLNWDSQVPKENQPQKVSLGAAPMYATNGSTRIMSTDGGKTWQPAR